MWIYVVNAFPDESMPLASSASEGATIISDSTTNAAHAVDNLGTVALVDAAKAAGVKK